MPRQTRPSAPESFPYLSLAPDARREAYTKDREGFFAVVRILHELCDREHVPIKKTHQILGILLDHLSHGRHGDLRVQQAMMVEGRDDFQRERTRLRREVECATKHPPDPPRTLKERLTRESVDPKLERLGELDQLSTLLEDALKKCEQDLTSQRFRGHNVAIAGRKIMDLLTKQLRNQKKASIYTLNILTAWDRASAPTSAEHIRTAHLFQRRQRRRQQK